MSDTKTTVLAAARQFGFVPCVIPGVDPRALGSAVRSLIADGALAPIPQADGAYAKGGSSYTFAPSDEERGAVAGVETLIAWLTTPVARLLSRCGVMVRSYHTRYTKQGGGCLDNVDTTMRDAFLTLVTPDADTPKCDTVALKAWGVAIGLWREKWECRNAGMQRMNLANVVRGAIRKGATIELNGTVLTVPAR